MKLDNNQTISFIRINYGIKDKSEIERFLNLFQSPFIPNNTIAISHNWFAPIETIPNLCDWFMDCRVIRKRVKKNVNKGLENKDLENKDIEKGDIIKGISKAYIFKNENGKVIILDKATYLEKSSIWLNDLKSSAYNQRKAIRNIKREKAQKENQNKITFAEGQRVIKNRKKPHLTKETDFKTFNFTNCLSLQYTFAKEKR